MTDNTEQSTLRKITTFTNMRLADSASYDLRLGHPNRKGSDQNLK